MGVVVLVNCYIAELLPVVLYPLSLFFTTDDHRMTKDP